jgi:hypothetical protein
MFNIGGITKTFKGLVSKKETPKYTFEDDIRPGVIRKVVECEDGKKRIIQNIHVPVSKDKRDCYIINEGDPESPMGHFVHIYDIIAALENRPGPSKESKEAASRLWKQMVIADAKSLHKGAVKGNLPLDFT